MIKIKRIYENAGKEDGIRNLVDRLWPRGIKKVDAKIDEWIKDIGPSDKLRKWFGHDPKKWSEFKKRYIKELKDKTDFVRHLKSLAQKGTLTLLYSAKDEKHNQAIVIKEYIENKTD